MKKLPPMMLFMALLCISTCLSAQNIPHTFSPNTPAKASEVNANFQALLVEIQTLKTDLANTKADLATANAKIATLQADSLAEHVSIQTVNGYTTVWVEGANLQVVNGMGATNGDPALETDDKGPTNGLGNVIIGYNEATFKSFSTCSDGRVALDRDPDKSAPEECRAGINAQGQPVTDHLGNAITAVWGRAGAHRTGSHNLVVGAEHGYSSHGGLLAGYASMVNMPWGSVSGGKGNLASGKYSSVSGGERNKASGNTASISGGGFNTAPGNQSSVTGGSQNTALALRSSVTGGNENIAAGTSSSVSGGRRNQSSRSYTSISGGYQRSTEVDYEWVAGGLSERVP